MYFPTVFYCLLLFSLKYFAYFTNNQYVKFSLTNAEFSKLTEKSPSI